MASAAWGEQVALTLGKDVVVGDGAARALLTEALTALTTLEPGSERRARDLALRSWKKAADDVGRGSALAIVALSLVVDPAVEGYTERLIDASGLAIYAGTVDSSDPVAQCARAVIAAAGGSARQARELVDLVQEGLAMSKANNDDVRGWLAIARDSVRDRSDAFYVDAKRGLAARPENIRLQALYADHLLDLGFADEALQELGTSDAPSLVVLRARAELERGAATRAVELLQPLATRLIGVDEPRRAEALFWLGKAQLAVEPGADLTAAKATITALEPRPGWAKETRLLNAIVARLEGRAADAQQALMPLALGTPTSTLVIERHIVAELLPLCAASKDAACVEKAGRRASMLDVDPQLVVNAKASLLPADESKALADEAQRLAPGPRAADVLKVRRALAAKAPSLARPVLDALLKDPQLRVARALRVPLAGDPPETARFAAAAITGLGLPLAERDLVDVVTALGAHKLKDSDGLLKVLDKDARPAVQRAVQLARADLKDPDARRKRLAADRGVDVDGHDHGPALPPGATPDGAKR